MQARKIVVSGEAAGLQIQLGPPAARAGSTPVIFRQSSSSPIRESLKNPLFSITIVD